MCSTTVHIQFVWQVLATFLCSTFGHIQFVQQLCAYPVRVTYPLRVTSGGTLEGSPDTSTAFPLPKASGGDPAMVGVELIAYLKLPGARNRCRGDV